MSDSVRRTREFQRILALPRRTIDDFKDLAVELTELLKTPQGTMKLKPVQALALHDIGVHGGAFLPIGVGEGKTLISLLAAYLVDAKRPLLLLPAGLREGADRARELMSQHWNIPKHLRLHSYEMLGRASGEHFLEEDAKPDLFILDEAHRCKNMRAACTRRVARYMAKHPTTGFVAMSGTMMRDSIHDFSHLNFWALKHGAPLPAEPHELDDWAAALAEPKAGQPGMEYRTVEPGALLEFCTPQERAEHPAKKAARIGFRRRMNETPGVVSTAGDREKVDCSIYIRAEKYEVAPITEEHFRTLRGDPKSRGDYPGWQRPDGKEFEQGVEVWNCARQLALGLHYEWDPPPPQEWMDARKEWSRFVRAVLANSRTLDSPLTVINAIDAGKIKDPGGLLERWRSVRGSFKPRTVAVWHDTTVLEKCAAWAKGGGIVWTEHHHFAERLSKETGLPYFGAKGLDRNGVLIEDSKAKACIASIDANRDGKNLQFQWSRNLIVCPPDGWDVWQQTIARTHRDGQTADEVIVDVLLGCREHVNAWRKAWAGTHANNDMMGATAKLFLADVSFPSDEDIGRYVGFRW